MLYKLIKKTGASVWIIISAVPLLIISCGDPTFTSEKGLVDLMTIENYLFTSESSSPSGIPIISNGTNFTVSFDVVTEQKVFNPKLYFNTQNTLPPTDEGYILYNGTCGESIQQCEYSVTIECGFDIIGNPAIIDDAKAQVICAKPPTFTPVGTVDLFPVGLELDQVSYFILNICNLDNSISKCTVSTKVIFNQ